MRLFLIVPQRYERTSGCRHGVTWANRGSRRVPQLQPFTLRRAVHAFGIVVNHNLDFAGTLVRCCALRALLANRRGAAWWRVGTRRRSLPSWCRDGFCVHFVLQLAKARSAVLMRLG